MRAEGRRTAAGGGRGVCCRVSGPPDPLGGGKPARQAGSPARGAHSWDEQPTRRRACLSGSCSLSPGRWSSAGPAGRGGWKWGFPALCSLSARPGPEKVELRVGGVDTQVVSWVCRLPRTDLHEKSLLAPCPNSISANIPRCFGGTVARPLSRSRVRRTVCSP